MADPCLGQTAAALLRGPQIVAQEVLLAALVNDLVDWGDSLILALDERTEGWVAGLQLAALRLAGEGEGPAQDAAAFIHHFSGAQRYILD